MTGYAPRVARRPLLVAVVLAALVLALGLLGLCYGASWATPG
ncbi:iron-enterobactin ABC transporter permease, partial [Streptomyces sp. SID6139]|nr:iron-enterobactin ABC transporter permease [Streptomyces sp. SID6139]